MSEEINKMEIIREIQLTNLKSLKKLDEVCKKYNLKYWAAYGTLLGAIRHDGFIPWDDDLDVGMLREDYEKLCVIPQYEWGEDCIFCDGKSEDIRHDKIFGRVYQKNTRIQSYDDVFNWINPKNGEPWSTSLMCDIFIFDKVPEDKATWKKIYLNGIKLISRYKILKLKPRVSLDKNSLSKNIKALLKLFYRFIFINILKKSWKDSLIKHENNIKQCVIGYKIGTFYTIDPMTYDYSDIFPLEYHRFENMLVPIPKNWHQMLVDQYGDYMVYPPEDKRYHINFIYADLGNGRKFVIDPIKGSLGASDNQTN